jgi:hypothetical protein
MEILIFAFVAGLSLYRSKEKFVPETYPLQTLDLQTLKQVYKTKDDSSNRLSDRRRSYPVQALS